MLDSVGEQGAGHMLKKQISRLGQKRGGFNVVKTMPCLPPMTGNGKHTPYKKCWWLGDGANGIVFPTLMIIIRIIICF